MMWLDDLREEAKRRQDRGVPSGEALRQARAVSATDETVASADRLVRTLLDQMNQMLLSGRGSVWDAPAAWGLHLWELWWEPTREGGRYLLVTLLRDSRGTPYLRVQGRRLAMDDPRLERRLQRALRAAFLAPRTYVPPVRAPAEVLDPLRHTSLGIGRAEGSLPPFLPDFTPTPAGADTTGPGEETRGRAMRTRRRGRPDGRDNT